MKKQDVYQIIAVVASALLILFAWLYVSQGGSIFKGKMEGETVRCKVIRVLDVTTDASSGNEFVTVSFKAQALSGELRGKTLEVVQEIEKAYVLAPKQVEQGDTVLVEGYTQGGEQHYYFGDYVRITPMIWLLVIFCVCVVIFSRMQGVKTLVSLAFTCLSVFCVLIPAVLNGHNIFLWSSAVCVFITVMTLSIVSGLSIKSLCAGIGCICGVMCAGLIVLISDKFLNMTGLIEEESVYLLQLDSKINLKAIIFAMIIIGAVGAVMDVAMSISSSLYELRIKSPDITASELMKSGFTIGRDMMGTMANTLVLAYIGSSLTGVLLMVANYASIEQVINKELIIAEILQALAGSMGILLSLPLTSIVCAALYYNSKEEKHNALG